MPSPTNPFGQSPIPCWYPSPKPPANVYDTPITIIVGHPGSEKTYHIYRSLLCHRSRYFDRLLNGPLCRIRCKHAAS
ncbi:BTB domain containing protein [Pyrenophora tritici-repentis]|nr:BTB domain containing protein [Pyrenophora tritici-repentis]